MRNSVGSSGLPSPATAHCYFSHRNLHQGRRCGRIMHPVYLWLVRSKFTRLLRESSGHGSTPARDRVKSCCFFLSPPPPPPPFFFFFFFFWLLLFCFFFCSVLLSQQLVQTRYHCLSRSLCAQQELKSLCTLKIPRGPIISESLYTGGMEYTDNA